MSYVMGWVIMIASPGTSCDENSVKCPCTVIPLDVILPVPVYSFSSSSSPPEEDAGASSLAAASGSLFRLGLFLQNMVEDRGFTE